MALHLEALSWAQAAHRCSLIREQVFIREQGIDPAVELDGLDVQCHHVIATQDDTDTGTARMQQDGHIGRVAVLAEWRHQGIGRALVLGLCQIAREQSLPRVYLASQQSAIGFYEQLGFRREGEPFMEAGIPHQTMTLNL